MVHVAVIFPIFSLEFNVYPLLPLLFAVTEGYVGATKSEHSPVSSQAISHSLEA